MVNTAVPAGKNKLICVSLISGEHSFNFVNTYSNKRHNTTYKHDDKTSKCLVE